MQQATSLYLNSDYVFLLILLYDLLYIYVLSLLTIVTRKMPL